MTPPVISLLQKLRTSPAVVLFVVTFALFTEEFLYGMVAPLTPESAAHISDEHLLSTLYGAYAVGLIISTPILALVTDRIGRRIPLVAGGVFLVISAILFLIGSNHQMFFLGRVFEGMGAACTWTAGLALVAEYYTKDRVKGMGIAMLGATSGSIIGPMLGGQIFDHWGYAVPFYLAIAFLIIDLVLRLSTPPVNKLNKVPPWSHTISEVKGIVTDRAVLSAAFAVSLAAAGWALMEPLFPMHVSRIAQATPGTIGALFTVSNLLYAVITAVVVMVSDRIGVRPTMVVGLVITAVSMPLLAFTPNIPLAAVVLCLVTVGYAFTINPTSAELGDAVDRRGSKSYAIAYGIYNLAYSLGMIGVDTFVEIVTDEAHKFELVHILLVVSVLFLLCIPLFLGRPSGTQSADSIEEDRDA